MEIQPKKPTAKGPAQMFTGDVWIDAIGDASWGDHVTDAEYHESAAP
jgi:hypothetical protein